MTFAIAENLVLIFDGPQVIISVLDVTLERKDFRLRGVLLV